MKRIIVLVLALCMCLSLFACGKSEDVAIVEGFINDIGEVTLESGEAIQKARHAYDMLSDRDKEKVENINTLKDAEYYYGKLVEETDNLIADARVLFEEEHNVIGALELLNTARETANADQLKEIDELTEEIEFECYSGTHFKRYDYVTTFDGEEYNTSREEEGVYFLDKHIMYCSLGELPKYFYSNFVSGYETEFMSPAPEWVTEITHSTSNVIFYYDDLGNVLVELNSGGGDNCDIEIYIFYADFVASQS